MKNDIEEVLISKEDIDLKVKEMGKQISEDYKGKDLLLIGVLKGAFIFLADLMRHISIPVEVDFMAVSSYGTSTKSSGVVRIMKDLDSTIEGKEILFVEDIIDTGLTLNYLIKNFKTRGAKSVNACTLLDKPERREADVSVKYKGFDIPDKFIVGYGLDYAQKYRNLDQIYILKEEAYN